MAYQPELSLDHQRVITLTTVPVRITVIKRPGIGARLHLDGFIGPLTVAQMETLSTVLHVANKEAVNYTKRQQEKTNGF